MSDHIGSVSVEVVPDATGFQQKLKAKLHDIEVKVGVNLDAEKAKASLDKLSSAKRSVTVQARLDDAHAKAKLDELGRTRTAKIRADVDRASVSRASSDLSSLSSDLFSLKGAIITLGPALIPVTAAVVGLAGALAAPLAAGGVGGLIFGGFATAALAKAKKDAKAIADLRKKATAATDPAAAKAFTKQADQMFADLGKPERKFIEAQGTISTAFDSLLKRRGVGAALFGPLTAGAELIAKVLPKTAPLLRAMGAEVLRVEASLSRFSDSPKFKAFINYLSHEGVRAIQSFVKIAGHLALGVASMLKAFTPAGQGLLDRFAKSLRGFDNVGKSKGFQGFLSYVSQQGPIVARTLGHIGQAAGNLITALAPQGSTILGVIDRLAVAVAKMKPSQIAATATAVGALGLATGKFSKLTSLSLLVSGLSYAYKHSDAFRTLADDAGRLASALNKMPDIAKLSLGVGAAVSAFAGGSSVGKGGGVVSKVLGSAVQKVFVVNPGFGGGGGLPGKGVPGKATTAAEEAATVGKSLAKLALPVAAIVASVAIINKLARATTVPGQSADVAFRHPTAASPLNANPAIGTKPFLDGSLGKLGKIAQDAAPATKNWDQAVASLDGHFAALKKTDPAKALTAIQSLSKQTGLSMAQLSAILPKSTHAFGDLRKAADRLTSGGYGHKISAAMDFDHFVDQAHKAGLSTGELNKKMRSLPKQVLTKFFTPGAVESKAQARALARQYGLTPKQVRTLMQLLGVKKSKDDADAVRTRLGILSRTNPKPRVSITDRASGPISAVKRMMDQLNGKHSSVFITTYTNTQAGRAQGANNRKPRANGGWVFGPGTSRSDSIPASLSNGEYVVNAASAKANAALLESINGARAAVGQTRFATGGSVQSGGSSGVTVLQVYDTDGVFQGQIRTTARSEINGQRSHDARLGRQSR